MTRSSRFFGALSIALLVATGVASADCYIYGKDGLKPWDYNKCRTIIGGFRCPSNTRWTIVSFRDEKRKDGCSVTVEDKSTIFSSRWDVTPRKPGGWATWTCSVTQVGNNTYDIYPPH